jgi:hypothetical protein
MSETSNYGIYFNDVPTVNYGFSGGFRYIINLSSDLVHEAYDGLIQITTGAMSNTNDEIILNSIMTIFNSMYDLRERDEIREFLKNNASLIPVLSEAYNKLQIYFPYSTIFAEVIQDELVISVGTTLSPREAKKQLYKFDEEWWLDVCNTSRSKLCITVEFQ